MAAGFDLAAAGLLVLTRTQADSGVILVLLGAGALGGGWRPRRTEPSAAL